MQKIIYFIILLVISCSPKPEPAGFKPMSPKKVMTDAPKNIVLVIVEGMGLAHVTAGLYRSKQPLSLEKFPVTGIHLPSIGNNLVGDSLSSIVALSCGIYLNKIPETDTIKRTSILINAKRVGKSVGIITDKTIDSALPSAFIAYQHTNKYKNIMASFFGEEIDLFIGKWHPHFKKYKVFKNYQFLDLNQWVEVDASKNLIGIIDEQTTQQQKITQIGLGHLQKKSEEGFFLVIENNKVAEASLKNDAAAIVEAIIDFDKTISTIVDFAKQNKETLVLVTSNQEMGGFALNPGSSRDTVYAGFTSRGATGIFLPTFAYGPGANLFEGMYPNTAIYKKMNTALQ